MPGSPDPGHGSMMDELESDLDLEVVGGVAPNASIIFVTSTNALASLEYAIEQNLAQVVSMSYGWDESNDTLVRCNILCLIHCAKPLKDSQLAYFQEIARAVSRHRDDR